MIEINFIEGDVKMAKEKGKDYFEITCHYHLAVSGNETSLDKAIERLDSYRGTLQEMLTNAPDPRNLHIYHKNREDVLAYERPIVSPEDISLGCDVLDYIMHLPTQHRPFEISVDLPSKYVPLCTQRLKEYGVVPNSVCMKRLG